MSDEKQVINNEEEVLRKLIQAKNEIPKKKVFLKRLGVEITLRALKSTEIFYARERSTIRLKNGQEKFDNEKFYCLVVAQAIESPNLKDKKLLEAYNAITPEEVVKELFLSGELIQLADIVLDISGYNEEIEDIKNL